jgi:hypothetical protein
MKNTFNSMKYSGLILSVLGVVNVFTGSTQASEMPEEEKSVLTSRSSFNRSERDRFLSLDAEIERNPKGLLNTLIESRIPYEMAEALLYKHNPSLHKQLADAKFIHTDRYNQSFIGKALWLAADITAARYISSIPGVNYISESFATYLGSTGVASMASSVLGVAEEWVPAGVQGMVSGLAIKGSRLLQGKFNYWTTRDKTTKARFSQTSFEQFIKINQGVARQDFEVALKAQFPKVHQLFDEAGLIQTNSTAHTWRARSLRVAKKVGNIAVDLGVSFAIPVVGIQLKKIAIATLSTTFNQIIGESELTTSKTVVSDTVSSLQSSSVSSQLFASDLPKAIQPIEEATRSVASTANKRVIEAVSAARDQVASSLTEQHKTLVNTVNSKISAVISEETSRLQESNWAAVNYFKRAVRGLNNLVNPLTDSQSIADRVTSTLSSTPSTPVLAAFDSITAPTIDAQQIVGALPVIAKDSLQEQLFSEVGEKMQSALISHAQTVASRVGDRIATSIVEVLVPATVSLAHAAYPRLKDSLRVGSLLSNQNIETDELEAMTGQIVELNNRNVELEENVSRLTTLHDGKEQLIAQLVRDMDESLEREAELTDELSSVKERARLRSRQEIREAEELASRVDEETRKALIETHRDTQEMELELQALLSESSSVDERDELTAGVHQFLDDDADEITLQTGGTLTDIQKGLREASDILQKMTFYVEEDEEEAAITAAGEEVTLESLTSDVNAFLAEESVERAALSWTPSIGGFPLTQPHLSEMVVGSGLLLGTSAHRGSDRKEVVESDASPAV